MFFFLDLRESLKIYIETIPRPLHLWKCSNWFMMMFLQKQTITALFFFFLKKKGTATLQWRNMINSQINFIEQVKKKKQTVTYKKKKKLSVRTWRSRKIHPYKNKNILTKSRKIPNHFHPIIWNTLCVVKDQLTKKMLKSDSYRISGLKNTEANLDYLKKIAEEEKPKQKFWNWIEAW